MSYFDKFTRINYQDKRVVNIFDSIIMKYQDISRNSLFYKYSIIEGEKPEHIAYNIYGDATLHWIILLTNKIVDPNFDWYLTNWEVEANTEQKYVDGKNGIHHYEVLVDFDRFKAGDWTDSYYDEVELVEYKAANGGELPIEISPITNYNYESDENEKRREINIISVNHISKIISNFEAMLTDENIYLTTIEV